MAWENLPRHNVAMFIDLENLFGGYGRDVTTVPLGKLAAGVEVALRTSGLGAGRAVARAYANWGHPDMGVYRREVQASGIEPIQVFAFDAAVKNAADIELCVDALEVAHDSPWLMCLSLSRATVALFRWSGGSMRSASTLWWSPASTRTPVTRTGSSPASPTPTMCSGATGRWNRPRHL